MFILYIFGQFSKPRYQSYNRGDNVPFRACVAMQSVAFGFHEACLCAISYADSLWFPLCLQNQTQ